MAVGAVQVNPPAALDHARLVVGKGGAHVRAHLDDLRLAEGRMQREGGAQQFDRRARA